MLQYNESDIPLFILKLNLVERHQRSQHSSLNAITVVPKSFTWTLLFLNQPPKIPPQKDPLYNRKKGVGNLHVKRNNGAVGRQEGGWGEKPTKEAGEKKKSCHAGQNMSKKKSPPRMTCNCLWFWPKASSHIP